MRSIGLSATAVLAIAAFGCSANVSATPEQADAEASSTATALVAVQRADGARSEAVARFMRARGRDQADALRVVGAAVDIPALGSCVSLSSLGGTAPMTSVQLLDVGAVTMEANGVQTQLFARQVPDVVDLVSGTVYARAADAELLPARSHYVLRVAGAADADAFVVEASAPADVAELRFAGQELTWEPGAAEDLVYVDINAVESVHLPTIRCAFADAGHATIAAALLPDDGTLTVHRVHRERFRARGIDSGEIRFDFSKIVSFARR